MESSLHGDHAGHRQAMELWGSIPVDWASYQHFQGWFSGKSTYLAWFITTQAGTPSVFLLELAGLISGSPCRMCVLPVTVTVDSLSHSHGGRTTPETLKGTFAVVLWLLIPGVAQA